MRGREEEEKETNEKIEFGEGKIGIELKYEFVVVVVVVVGHDDAIFLPEYNGGFSFFFFLFSLLFFL